MSVHARISLLPFLAGLLLLTASPRAAEVGYPTLIAGQLATAMDLSREEGKALEGVTVKVELDLEPGGKVRDAVIVAVEKARSEEDRRSASAALGHALDHFRSTPFKGLDSDDYATWGHMRLTFQLGLHVGGYQP